MESHNANLVRFSDEKERLDFFYLNIAVHEKLVRSICVSILDNCEDIDDAVQDTMLSAWTKLDSLREKDAAKAWLCTIARRSALDMKERIQRSLSINCLDEFGNEMEERLVSSAPGPEEHLLLLHQCEMAETAYRMLPEKYQTLLYMRFFLDWDNGEINRAMGMDRRSCINACSKAKAAIRSNLSKLQM